MTAPELGTGYFQNFGETRREGIDADLGGTVRRVTWGLDYTLLSATYQSTDSLDGGAEQFEATARLRVILASTATSTFIPETGSR